jgi:Uma2 family endonuclease
MAETPKRATYADIEAAPEHLVAEIIDGKLRTHPRPSPRHVTTAFALAVQLGGPYQNGVGGPGGWVFGDEPELHLGLDVLVPDIAGWRRGRLDALPQTRYFTIRPDWVCEVLSGSTEVRDRTVKMRIYGAAGVPYLWLIDPRQQMIEAFENHDALWVKKGDGTGGDVISLPPFDAISFSLADLWPLDKPLGFNEDPTALYAGDR